MTPTVTRDSRSRDSQKAAGIIAKDKDAERPLLWPHDPENLNSADIDFEALAHVLANSCCWGRRSRHYHSLAHHGVIVSEEIEALDGLAAGDRRILALHALLADGPSAWLRGEPAGSQRAAERTGRLASAIGTALREAAGLDKPPAEEQAELLRFIERMTVAAERRDLFEGDSSAPGGTAFPPLKRRIKPVAPDRAARLWLERFRALAKAGAPETQPGGGVKTPDAAEGRDGKPGGRDAQDGA